jgi:hypothetical protein
VEDAAADVERCGARNAGTVRKEGGGRRVLEDLHLGFPNPPGQNRFEVLAVAGDAPAPGPGGLGVVAPLDGEPQLHQAADNLGAALKEGARHRPVHRPPSEGLQVGEVGFGGLSLVEVGGEEGQAGGETPGALEGGLLQEEDVQAGPELLQPQGGQAAGGAAADDQNVALRADVIAHVPPR